MTGRVDGWVGVVVGFGDEGEEGEEKTVLAEKFLGGGRGRGRGRHDDCGFGFGLSELCR